MKKRSRSSDAMESQEPEWDIQKIMKDIEFLSASHMTWKERKELENRKVVSLGGKATKKHRLPLSVARPMMKKQKEREQKRLQMEAQEYMVLARFGGKIGGGKARKPTDKRKPEDRVLKSTVGDFRNGVLDVKNMFKKPAPSRDDNSGSSRMMSKEKKGNRGGKKNNGKKKGGGGGGRKRH